eukprot:3489082-Rhodomonas_salina.2
MAARWGAEKLREGTLGLRSPSWKSMTADTSPAAPVAGNSKASMAVTRTSKRLPATAGGGSAEETRRAAGASGSTGKGRLATENAPAASRKRRRVAGPLRGERMLGKDAMPWRARASEQAAAPQQHARLPGSAPPSPSTSCSTVMRRVEKRTTAPEMSSRVTATGSEPLATIGCIAVVGSGWAETTA